MHQQQRASLRERSGTQKEVVEVDAMSRLNRSHTSRSDPFGLRRAESFRNFLEDSVSFHFSSQRSLDEAPLLTMKFALSLGIAPEKVEGPR
jgi:hypothetical protein